MKKGFTLIEMTIVIVIVGLLIGGLMLAQSLISASRMQSFANQIGQYDVAVASYVSTYGQLPGDSTITGASRGNGDGLISLAQPNIESEGYICTTNNMYGEIGKFWSDLSKAGLIKNGNTDYADDSTGGYSTEKPDVAMPRATVGINAYFVPMCGSATPNFNFFHITGRQPGLTITNDPAFTPEEVLAIDSKIDNGRQDGNMYAVGANCFNGLLYDIMNEDVDCTIMSRMGFTAGKAF